MTTGEKAKRPSFNSSRGAEFGSLAKVFDDVWWAWGTTRFMPGFAFPRNMTVVREADGLVIIHPVMMPEPEQKKLEALGPIKHIVRLGDFHGMDDALYVARYGAKLWAPRGVASHEGARVDVEMVPGGELPLADASFHAFEVALVPEAVIHIKRHGGVLLTCDSIQNWESTPDGCSFLASLLRGVMGFKGRACIGPGWRKASEPKTGENFGPRFRALLELEFKHIISAHGPPMLDTAKESLRASVDKLYPR